MLTVQTDTPSVDFIRLVGIHGSGTAAARIVGMSKTSFFRGLTAARAALAPQPTPANDTTPEPTPEPPAAAAAAVTPVTEPSPATPSTTIATSSDPAVAAILEALRQQGELIARLMGGQSVPASAVAPACVPVPEPEVEWVPPTYRNDSVLVISDLHSPYEHPDALAFLSALQSAYQFERAICTGDEGDGHAISFHTSNPDLPSAGQETDAMRAYMAKLHAVFPVLDLMDSNHGSLIYRRQQDAGLPAAAMQSYRGFIFGERRKDGSTFFPGDIGSKWRWHSDMEIQLSNGERVLFAHGLAANVKLAAQKVGMSVVQGHYHSSYDCVSMQGPRGAARFGITGGCLINPDSYAFAYGKNLPPRPIIGCSGILDGLPVQFRMPLDARGRWTGRLPYGILPQREAA